MNKILKPNSILVEKVASEFAATWFEAGLNTLGMDMLRKKYKNDPRIFARKNLEKFIPQAISTLLDMLNRQDIRNEVKEEIYDAIMDRVNDDSNVTSTEIKGLPNIDVKALLDLTTSNQKRIDQLLNPPKDKPLSISSNPFKAQRH